MLSLSVNCVLRPTGILYTAYCVARNMGFSIAQWKELCLEMETFENSFHQAYKCQVTEFGTENLNNIQVTRGKDSIFGDWVVKFSWIYSTFKEFGESAGPAFEELSTAMSKQQEKVIALQEDLLARKDEQLATLQSSVKDEVAVVKSAVQSEISNSWSKIVEKSTPTPAFCPVKLKEAVKCAVVEEDRSHNLMIFGKQEVDNEDVSNTVASIFEDLNEKPHVVECRRLGDPKHGRCRPIKARLSSSDAVLHILRKAKCLKSSDGNGSTYIVRDRSRSERDAHKVLVETMRQKMLSEPELYHFIRGEEVISVKKKSTA